MKNWECCNRHKKVTPNHSIIGADEGGVRVDAGRQATERIVDSSISMKKTLKEYLRALGKWLWVLIVDIIGIIQDLLFDIPYIKRLPIEVWIFLFLLFIIIANIHAFHKLRIQRDTLILQLENKEMLRGLLRVLAQLRTEGVALRNKGMSLSQEDNLGAWIDQYRNWKDRVISEIEKLSPAQAELFRTRDWVEIRPFSEEVPRDVKLFVNMLSDELKDLKTLIERLEPIVGEAAVA